MARMPRGWKLTAYGSKKLQNKIVVEQFSKSSKIKTKFRKIIVDNIKIAIKKINDYLIKVEAEG